MNSDVSDAIDPVSLFAFCESSEAVAIACSGGRDSLALAFLFRLWRRRRRAAGLPSPRPLILTVDHGLRADSAADASYVVDLASSWGMEARSLRWTPPDRGHVMAQARHGRYRLMGDHCAGEGIGLLLTGHTRDDCVENSAMSRLGARFGAPGERLLLRLAAGDVCVHRPLLSLSRSRLTSLLNAAGLAWRDDPTNEDRRFLRARLRADLAATPAAIVEALAAACDGERRRRREREHSCAAALASCAAISHGGHARLDLDLWRRLDEETACFVLTQLVHRLGGGSAAPRGRSARRLSEALRRRAVSATLGGCFLAAQDDAKTAIMGREWGRRGLPSATLRPGGAAIWDRRFRLRLADRRALRDMGPLTIAPWRPPAPPGRGSSFFPPRTARAMPGLYVGDRLVATPHDGYCRPPMTIDDLSCESLVQQALTGDGDKRRALIFSDSAPP